MTARMTCRFPLYADYLDIMPSPPLGEEEIRVLDELGAMIRKFVKEHEITFVTPKAPPTRQYNVGELLWIAGAGEREGRTNVMTFQLLKARETGKPVMYIDTEASFDPDQLGFIVGSEKL